VTTRGIIFAKAFKLNGSLWGEKNDPRFFDRMKQWFYGGFNKCAKLSKRHVSSIGQKLPPDWKVKVTSIINRVAAAQMPIPRSNGTFIHGVLDDFMANTDQVPIYVEGHSNTTWGLRESVGRRCVATAGKNKDRFTVQLTCFKSGRKAAPAPCGQKCGRKKTVTYDIYHNVPDWWGNHFPSNDEMYITVYPTANSNGDLTIDYVRNVFFGSWWNT